MNTLNNKGPKIEPLGTPLAKFRPWASCGSYFYTRQAVTQVVHKKLTGRQINTISMEFRNL